MIIIFKFHTPRPHRRSPSEVLINSADCTVSQVVGAQFVRSHVGDVILTELTPDLSISRMLGRVQRRL